MEPLEFRFSHDGTSSVCGVQNVTLNVTDSQGNLVTGFLGGFTTFSAFSLDFALLVERKAAGEEDQRQKLVDWLEARLSPELARAPRAREEHAA